MMPRTEMQNSSATTCSPYSTCPSLPISPFPHKYALRGAGCNVADICIMILHPLTTLGALTLEKHRDMLQEATLFMAGLG